MPADMTLVDVLGTDPLVLYAAGQTLTVLEGVQKRQPDLYILLLEGEPPRLLGLRGGRIYTPPSAIPRNTDLPHSGILRAHCLQELAVEPIELSALEQSRTAYEVRPGSLEAFRQATWKAAAAADVLVEARQESGGLLARLRGRNRQQAAERVWTEALAALVPLAAQLPILELERAGAARV